jgi:hypothetical protein
MGFAGPLVGHRGTVALQHGPGCPARQPHEVGLAAAPAEPAVGVEVIDAGLPAPAAEEPGDAGVGDAALAADPAPRQFGVWMASAGAVAVRGRGRLPARANSPARKASRSSPVAAARSRPRAVRRRPDGERPPGRSLRSGRTCSRRAGGARRSREVYAGGCHGAVAQVVERPLGNSPGICAVLDPVFPGRGRASEAQLSALIRAGWHLIVDGRIANRGHELRPSSSMPEPATTH